MRLCSIDGCDRAHKARGLCSTHYSRLRRYGHTDPPRKSILDRLMEKVDVTETCWLWTACIDDFGYGRQWDGAAARRAHRLMYELMVGPIPTGKQIDHLCRVRHCVNPDHLEAVTPATNTRRGMSPSTLAARSGCCMRGHEYTEENTHVTRNGWKVCRTCRRLRDRGELPPLRTADGQYGTATVEARQVGTQPAPPVGSNPKATTNGASGLLSSAGGGLSSPSPSSAPAERRTRETSETGPSRMRATTATTHEKCPALRDQPGQ